MELEPCGNDLYLGFRLDIRHRSVRYVIPSHMGQYRSPRSAGTLRLRLSGFRARLHILFQGTWPKNAALESAHALLNMYEKKGFTRADLAPILAAVRRQFQNLHLSAMPCLV